MARFLDMLGEQRNGDLLPELDEVLTTIVSAVRDVGKVGKLTLTITVKPYGKGKAETLLVEDKVVVTLPELDKGGSVFFTNEDNDLEKEDPRQMKLEGLREVKETK